MDKTNTTPTTTPANAADGDLREMAAELCAIEIPAPLPITRDELRGQLREAQWDAAIAYANAASAQMRNAQEIEQDRDYCVAAVAFTEAAKLYEKAKRWCSADRAHRQAARMHERLAREVRRELRAAA